MLLVVEESVPDDAGPGTEAGDEDPLEGDDAARIRRLRPGLLL
jgi:hypothetical protein